MELGRIRGTIDQLPVGSGLAETCLVSTVGTSTNDGDVPAGTGYWYLVRGYQLLR